MLNKHFCGLAYMHIYAHARARTHKHIHTQTHTHTHTHTHDKNCKTRKQEQKRVHNVSCIRKKMSNNILFFCHRGTLVLLCNPRTEKKGGQDSPETPKQRGPKWLCNPYRFGDSREEKSQMAA